ncbi:SIS domain-containing protein [Pediococcus acidilactici]|uniref:SIS domain-containing protein n=1 Tax=Pediococcus acidilactici TaxID=1254 RepID=UPI00032715E8|nr:SIS domain-containing protein [Pediococcus acidilactici]EOA08078.1 glutamine-fructose-6-phosphate transaminase (isomerizing), glmS [Pediococcus acidilactici D3]MBW4798071.1 SIS domain-containing protein [Pediococcus acidilactici]MBW9307004.1 SIS domain-containing protein [Pediococcus acidilactici]MCE5962530.1 SIS domain-containing protein [Pediococcus acidilactici]MCW8083672.1 SIS domain-containing protein [Pediococcus acidilactici]
MKSINDYVHLEPKLYQQVLDNVENLFLKPLNQWGLSKFKRVMIYATGSSSNAAFGALPLMSKILGMPIQVEEPSISENYLMNIENDTLCLAISQGGHSYSVVKLVERLQKNQKMVVALTSEKDSPLARVSNRVLEMGMPVEEMPYVSAGYSVTILDLILIALVLSKKLGKISAEEDEKYWQLIQEITKKLPQVIKQSDQWVEKHVDDFSNAQRITFIGYGAAYGVAREGETKFTEAVRNNAWGKELEEYMHGPYLGLHAEDIIVFIEPNGKLADRAQLLRKFLKQHVNHVYTIYANQVNLSTLTTGDLAFEIATDELLAALFLTVPIHLMAYRLFQIKGVDLEHSAYPDFDQITASKI